MSCSTFGKADRESMTLSPTHNAAQRVAKYPSREPTLSNSKPHCFNNGICSSVILLILRC